MHRLFFFGWLVTAILFVIILLYVYAYLPESVVWNPSGQTTLQTLTRDSFFYLALILFVLTNVACFIFAKMLDLFKGSASLVSKNRILQESFITWFSGLAVVINLFFIASIVFIGLTNNLDEQQLSYFYFLTFLAPVLFSICLIWLVIILIRKK